MVTTMATTTSSTLVGHATMLTTVTLAIGRPIPTAGHAATAIASSAIAVKKADGAAILGAGVSHTLDSIG